MNQPLIQLIELPTVQDDCLLSIATLSQLPFVVKRIYYIYDALPKLSRGYHAHKQNKQILFCVNGSAQIVLDDGHHRDQILLDNPQTGVVLDKMIWHEMHKLSKKTILLVFSSEEYDEQDYIRNYKQFLKLVKK